MKTTTCLHVQRCAATVVSRPKSASVTVPAPIATRTATTGSWLGGVRTPMNVPAFHDRWPLCSPT